MLRGPAQTVKAHEETFVQLGLDPGLFELFENELKRPRRARREKHNVSSTPCGCSRNTKTQAVMPGTPSTRVAL